MNQEEIFALMDRFDASSAVRLRLTDGDFSLELEKPQASVSAAPAAPAAPGAEGGGSQALSAVRGKCITAPLVGTFYAASAPDAAPFVRPGDRVRKGETVCLLEAMKMMSEVQAPCDCVIEEILAQDGALVSFGEPLVRYREG